MKRAFYTNLFNTLLLFLLSGGLSIVSAQAKQEKDGRSLKVKGQKIKITSFDKE